VITIKEVLHHPIFNDAEVIAGKKGLGRKIRWVHILEIPDVEISIRGGELILSTGIGLGKNTSYTYFLERIIENGVACLCLELGEYFKEVPQEMITIADTYNFPLIVFRKTVRFVDITQELHSFIINRHHVQLKKLDSISREFQLLTLTSQSAIKILNLLYKNTNLDLVYLPIRSDPIFITNINNIEKTKVLDSIDNQKDFWKLYVSNEWSHLGMNYLAQPIGALGQIWGYLVLFTKKKKYEDFELLVLDRAVTALAQDILRKQYIDMQRLYEENLWIDDLLTNKGTNSHQITELLSSTLKDLDKYNFRVCLINMSVDTKKTNNTINDAKTYYMDLAVVAKNAFQNYSFYPFIIFRGSHLVILVFDLSSGKQEKERYLRAIKKIQDVNDESNNSLFRLKFGIGRSYENITNIHLSYDEAKKVIKITSLLQRLNNFFYEELGIYRLLINIKNEEDLQAFVNDYIGPLIDYDNTKNGGELIRTLKVYFEAKGSKVEATRELHIVRQTLYLRLERIKEILGEDFMSPEKRLLVELALKVNEWLNHLKSFNR
jgi:PucR family transcriptional regulator, purine catabolism regulatory protein